MAAFEEVGVMPEIISAVEDLGWTLPTDIQAEAIPLILGGGDVLMAAETGSGKTGAFCLPTLQVTCETIERLTRAKAAPKDQGASSSNQTRMSVHDRDAAFAIADSGLVCQARESQQWAGARATRGVVKGKCYYEVTVRDEGLVRIGWATATAGLELGTDQGGFGFGGTGMKSHARKFEKYGEAFGLGDVIGCRLDRDARTVHFLKNGADLGLAYELAKHLDGKALFPCTVVKNAELGFNFGGQPFAHAAGEGFVGLDALDAGAWAAATTKDMTDTTRAPYVLVLEPTRELTEQTDAQFACFRKHITDTPISHLALVAGDRKAQDKRLAAGVDIVTGSPGRIAELVDNKKLDLSNVRFFILDEADALLQDNKGLVFKLHSKLKKLHSDGSRLQMIVCSATLHNPMVKQIAEKMMHHPTWIDLKGMVTIPDTVHQTVHYVDTAQAAARVDATKAFSSDLIHRLDGSGYRLDKLDSDDAKSWALKQMKPHVLLEVIKQNDITDAIIFVRMKNDANHVCAFLNQYLEGSPATMLHAGLSSPADRKQNLQDFKDKKKKFLVCTDVAARGIDVRGLAFMINYTLPDKPEDYIHRVGRVGRADRMGLAITICAKDRERVWFHRGQVNYNKVDRAGVLKNSVWMHELRLFETIQERVGETVPELGPDLKAPVDSIDGVVTYGGKRKKGRGMDTSHLNLLKPSVAALAELEYRAQTSFFTLKRRWVN